VAESDLLNRVLGLGGSTLRMIRCISLKRHPPQRPDIEGRCTDQ
jgi:hypothetical protein